MNGLKRDFKPYPEYKPSSVEWIGDILKLWEIHKTKRLFNIINGATPKTNIDEFWGDEILWVTPDDLGWGFCICARIKGVCGRPNLPVFSVLKRVTNGGSGFQA